VSVKFGILVLLLILLLSLRRTLIAQSQKPMSVQLLFVNVLCRVIQTSWSEHSRFTLDRCSSTLYLCGRLVITTQYIKLKVYSVNLPKDSGDVKIWITQLDSIIFNYRQTLERRRLIADLVLTYRIIFGLIDLNMSN